MSLFRLVRLAPLFLIAIFFVPFVHVAHAATTPSLGAATTFGVLTYTYTNSSSSTSITGDLGYTVGPATAPSVSGTTHVNDATFTQAVNDQQTALTALNSQPCTFTFAGGNIDLATDTTHGPAGVFTPGVYCLSGNMTVGSGGSVTLSGAGTFIFRPTRTLATAQFAHVTGSNQASACDVFWTPTVPTTLGGDGDFFGTVIEPIGPVAKNITVNAGETWVGRALNGNIGALATVTTGADVHITAPSCGSGPAPGTLHVIKTFYNAFGGTAVASNVTVHVKNGAGDVVGSPHAGAASPGTLYTLNADTYAVSEDPFPGYSTSFSGDCDTTGHVTLAAGFNKTCTISNEQNPPANATLHVIKTFYNDYGGTAVSSNAIVHVKNGAGDVTGSPLAGAASPGTSYTLNADTYTVSEDAFAGYTMSFSGDCDATGHVTLAAGNNKTCTISNDQNPSPSFPATLHVIKHVINNSGGSATASSFTLHIKNGTGDVTGSPAAGLESPGRSYSLAAGTYAVSEDPSAGYTQHFSGDCDDGGNITLTSDTNKTCIITNDDIPPASVPPATLRVIKIVINDNGGTAAVSQAVIHVTNGLGDVAGSPQAGASSPGTTYALAAGPYNISENFFAGYTVKLGGDCNDNGDITLASGDDKTCTITNNDIANVVIPPVVVPPVVPPIIIPVGCDVCANLTYDVYIINPDLAERHTGTPWVRVTDRGNGVKRYSFEDATLDPTNPLYDYNDAVVDVDYADCKSVKFMFVSSDASWKHQIKFKVSIAGVVQSDTLVTDDSKAAVGTTKVVDATAGVNTQLACAVNPLPPMTSSAPTSSSPSTSSLPPTNAFPSSTSLLGKILLQVQQHGEAWYVLPKTGLRYYMKDGPTAYGMMRNFGLGITDKDLANIPSVASVDALKLSSSVCASNRAANAQKGKILLQVQQHGEAWYVDVAKCRRVYMKDGAEAYTLMRFLGLGITDADLSKIGIGQ